MNSTYEQKRDEILLAYDTLGYNQDIEENERQAAKAIDALVLEMRLVELDLLEQALNAGHNIEAFKLKRLYALEAALKEVKK